MKQAGRRGSRDAGKHISAAGTGDQLEAAAEAVRERLGNRRPEVAVVLGSGLGFLSQVLDAPVTIPYSEVSLMGGFFGTHAYDLGGSCSMRKEGM